MIKCLFFCLMCFPLLAGTPQYAPDLRDSSARPVWLGLVNPSAAPINLVLTGYSADGEVLGVANEILSAYAKSEWRGEELFENDELAWARIVSDGTPIGYLRYQGSSGSFSIVGLSTTAGKDVWVPQVNETLAGVAPKTVLINTAEVAGSASSHPTASLTSLDATQINETSLAIDGFESAFQQVDFDYLSAYAKAADLGWDQISSEQMQLTGVEHLVTTQGKYCGSLALPRTPYRRMVVSALQPLKSGWNRIVLINTNNSILRVDLTPHFAWYGASPYDFTFQYEPTTLYLEAGERRVIDLTRPTQLEVPANADWFDIQPFEGGLLGYQIFGSNDGKAVGTADISQEPGSARVIPHVLENASFTTQISIVNTDEKDGETHVSGYDNEGHLVGLARTGHLRSFEKKTFSLGTLFGSKADQVSWVQVRCSNGHMVTYAVLSRRDNTGIAGLKGVATAAMTDDNLFSANMEAFTVPDLKGQGWISKAYTHAGLLLDDNDIDSDSGGQAKPGRFFIEHNFNAGNGNFYLGYEPFHSGSPIADVYATHERVALIAPPIEVPCYGTWYLSYLMRFIDPEFTTEHSRYGLVWRIEGSENWNWFGVVGGHLLRPFGTLGDCWVNIQYRNDRSTITSWVPFETVLPPETAGQRIEVGYYYDFRPKSAEDLAPWMFMDDIKVRATANPHALFYPTFGQAVLTPEELALEVDPPIPSVGGNP